MRSFEIQGAPAPPRQGSEEGSPQNPRPPATLRVKARWRRAKAAVLALKDLTLLSEEALEDLAKHEPDALGRLQTCRGFLAQWGLLALYVASTPVKALASKSAVGSGKVQGSALVLLNAAASIVIGFAIGVQRDGLGRASAATVDLRALWRFGLTGALFAVSMILNIMAYGTELDAGTIQVLGQLQLPMSALFSQCVFGRRYSFNHWVMLSIITVSTFLFFRATSARDVITDLNLTAMTPEHCFLEYDPRIVAYMVDEEKCHVEGHEPRAKRSAQWGMVLVVGYVVMAVIASLVAEKFYKAAPRTPFYLQRVQMELSGIWVCIFSVFFVPAVLEKGAWNPNTADKLWWRETTVNCTETGPTEVGGLGLFFGFGPAALVQLFAQLMSTWLAGIVVKRFSTVVKNLTKSVGLAVTVVTSEIHLTDCWAEPLSGQIYIMTAVICLSSLVFSNLK